MALTTVDTRNFSEVELAAKAVAEQIEELQLDIASARGLAEAAWVGDGCTEFRNLYTIIDQQMKDISSEFWEIYDVLVETEGAYLQADNDVATAMASASNS